MDSNAHCIRKEKDRGCNVFQTPVYIMLYSGFVASADYFIGKGYIYD